MINVRNVGYGDLRKDKLEFLGDQKAHQLKIHSLQNEDIVFGRKGAVDRHLFVAEEQKGWIQGSDCIRLRLDPETVLPKFVSFAFRLDRHKNWMLAQSGNKATMASLNQEIIRRIPFRHPDLPTQERIAGVLSAYDDLIENNRRRIALLEQAARLLYREWFVHFRFPGHETTKFVDGLPEGWEAKTIAEVCKTVGGGTPSTKVQSYWDGGDVTWVTPTDITRNDCLALLDSEKKITREGLQKSSAKIVPPFTILMTSRASVGFFGMCDHDVCTNQGFINIIPNHEILRHYMLFNLMHRVEEIRLHAGGSTYSEISKSKFRALAMILPELQVIAAFDAKISPMMTQVRCMKKSISELTKARDLLLPRLMDGRIPV